MKLKIFNKFNLNMLNNLEHSVVTLVDLFKNSVYVNVT